MNCLNNRCPCEADGECYQSPLGCECRIIPESESDGWVHGDAKLCDFDPNCKRCNGTGVVPAYHDAPAMCDCERDWQPPDAEN